MGMPGYSSYERLQVDCRRFLMLVVLPVSDDVEQEQKGDSVMQKQTMTLAMLAMSLCLSMASGGATASAGPAVADQEPSKVILVVSFGTSYNESRELTIGGIEAALQAAYPEYEVRRAFTSQIIIDKLAARDGLKIDNVEEAMDRLVTDGVKEVVIQPTHVMSAYEYSDVVAEVTPYAGKFESLKIGQSLLSSDADYDEVVSIITEETKDYRADGAAIVFMGHGTSHEANATYAELQQRLVNAGYDNYFIGTVEAEPSLEDVMALVADYGATKIVLLPLMIVAGDHATNDMAGDEEGSWKSAFEAQGYKVECILKGLGQYAGIQAMFVKHLGETIAR